MVLNYFFAREVRDKNKESSIYARNSWIVDIYLILLYLTKCGYCSKKSWPKEKGQTTIIYKTYHNWHKRADKIYVLLFIQLLHIFINFNPGTTHQTSQSQAMQVWAHLRPWSPLHISLDLLSALHLNHGHSRTSPSIW